MRKKITIDGGVVAILEDVENNDEIADVVPDDYNYLFTIADLMLNLDADIKEELPKHMWVNIINKMIEFRNATIYDNFR